MITVFMPCLFLCNTCARAELRQQERARKLCSATLILDLRLNFIPSSPFFSFLTKGLRVSLTGICFFSNVSRVRVPCFLNLSVLVAKAIQRKAILFLCQKKKKKIELPRASRACEILTIIC